MATKIHLFVDTNVFLDFFFLSSEDLDNVKKIGAAIDGKALQFHVTEQVVSEMRRNRRNRIAAAMKKFREQKFNPSVPAFMRDLEDLAKYRDGLKDAKSTHASIEVQVDALIKGKDLAPDKAILQIFEAGTVHLISDDVYERALRRMRLGNPPGKGEGTIGDEVNWEILIDEVPHGEDIHIISQDSDFATSKEDHTPNNALQMEWAEQKGGTFYLYKSLSEFFKKHFPEIKLADEFRKAKLVKDLEESDSYSTTHEVVAKLRTIENFSPNDVKRLAQIMFSNSQVYQIRNDVDVSAFVRQLIDVYDMNAEDETVDLLNALD